MIDYNELLEEAKKARENAYAPFSGFAVGAALLTKEGNIYRGCNIESSVFSPTICAERVALSKAISEGEKNFVSIAIVGAPLQEEPNEVCYPCGVCRQVFSEHVDMDEFEFVLNNHGEPLVTNLRELLPKTFVFEKKEQNSEQ